MCIVNMDYINVSTVYNSGYGGNTNALLQTK